MNEKFVKVKRVESALYEVYKVEEDKIIKIGEKEISGRVNKTAIMEEYGVKEVLIRKISETVKIYGMPVDAFMEVAEVIEVKTTETKSEEAEAAEQN